MRKLILLMLAVTLTSCSNVKKFQTKKDIAYLNENNANTLIGVYDNNSEVYRNNKIHYLWPIIDFEHNKYKIKGLKIQKPFTEGRSLDYFGSVIPSKFSKH